MADEQATPPPAAKSGRKRLAIVLVAGLLVAGAAAAFVFLRRSQRAQAPAEPNPSPKAIFHLDEFVVNLAGPDDRAFIRVGIDLGLERPMVADKESKSADMVAPVRDVILATTAQFKADDLLTPQGKKGLKQAIVEALNRHLPNLHVQEIYFTEFLVQR